MNVFFFSFFSFLFGGWVLTYSLRFIANLVLEDTVERIYHQDVFAEQWVGLFLIRGENVVLLGEIVSVKKSPPPPPSFHATRIRGRGGPFAVSNHVTASFRILIEKTKSH